jgi:hypothetical protein
MLGFRGTLRDDLETLSRDHVEPARRAISKALNKQFEPPPKREPHSFVPPLLGQERLHRMILVWLLTVLPLSIAVVVAILQRAH